jgi:hypothetical protein
VLIGRLPTTRGYLPLVREAADTPTRPGSFSNLRLFHTALDVIAIEPSHASIKWRFGLDGPILGF